MDYQKHYYKLIGKARTRINEGYTERHHIIPKCLGGSDTITNLVALTAKEHFVAHHLLCKMFPENDHLVYAFYLMGFDPHKKRKITSQMYEVAKKHYAEMQRKRFKSDKNPAKTVKSRAISSKRMKERNPMHLYPEKNPFLGKSYVLGRKFYTDGIKNLYLNPTDPIPDGFRPGMAPYKRKRRGIEASHK